MDRTVLKRKFEDFYKALTEFLEDGEKHNGALMPGFDFSLPGREVEYIPELNDIKDISDAFENGEDFSVPFATAEILKLSLGTGNEFWLGNVVVSPWLNSNDIRDYGFEIRDCNGKAINEYYLSDYYQTEIDLFIEGVDFEALAEDINAFFEGYGRN